MDDSNFDTLFNQIQVNGSDHPDIITQMNAMSNDDLDRYMLYEIRREGGEVEIVELWCDHTDTLDDGYYPSPINDTKYVTSHRHMFFRSENNTWYQLSGPNILGLDGKCGDLLSKQLNKIERIVNIQGIQIFPKQI